MKYWSSNLLLKTNTMSWLPNSITKGMSRTPKIKWEEYKGQNYAGYYSHGEDITVVEHNEEFFASVIAHEFRHYQQKQYDRLGCSKNSHRILSSKLCYEDKIRQYFRTCWHEYDALLFEFKYAKSEANEWWLKKLVWED